MKKNLLILAAVFCCAMTTTVFTACSSSDDDNSPAQPKIVACQVDYSLDIPKETTQSTGLFGNLYLLCDKIEVGYIDENGQEQRETVNNGKWAKTVTYKKSFNAYIKLYLTKPSSLDIESLPYERYSDVCTVMPSRLLEGITEIYSDGTRKSPTLSSVQYVPKSAGPHSVGKNKLQTYFDQIFKEEDNILPTLMFSF